ncbi:hypothetical protein FJSC11DRAFT_0374 [Fischerella thermalis JSC-11]|uniref:Glyoxalase n=1 Tax=Fischerella thermalis JSC-11 TaxID=741277 RepID=G6FNC7_9CYAN|nr:hypothetical protein FJSC11DRAFT_0374 [Fischerella thermalis JSC-11]
MNFIHFEHINLSCKNIDDSRNFYQTLFPEQKQNSETLLRASHKASYYCN